MMDVVTFFIVVILFGVQVYRLSPRFICEYKGTTIYDTNNNSFTQVIHIGLPGTGNGGRDSCYA